MSHALDAYDAPLPRASLRASCDWGCPDCELICGILARTVRDAGADLAKAIAELPALPPEWRLLVITGFLGGLTTFSTFSAEVTALIQQGRMLWATGAIALHVAGSLGMTLLGLATVAALKRL